MRGGAEWRTNEHRGDAGHCSSGDNRGDTEQRHEYLERGGPQVPAPCDDGAGDGSHATRAWQSYAEIEAQSGAREMLRNHRVLRVALVEDRIPMQFVEWIGR